MSMAGKAADVGAVRDEDRFDAAAVDAWLREHRADLALTGLPEVQQFSKGASNLTYQLTYPEQALILRRPPAGAKIASAHDMGREFRVQRALKPTFPSVPEMVAYCDDDAVIGAEFYVMEKIEGTILRSKIPPGLGLSEQAIGDLCRSFIDNLVTLHNVDPTQPGLAEIGRGEGYVARQVTGWSKRYRAAKTWNVPSFERVMRWLEANQPPDVRNGVIHNDYRLDNVVLAPDDPSRIVGVLDWEMATLGDPLMDLGGALAYWIEADDGAAMQWMRRQPTHEPGMLTRDEVVRYYGQQSGLPIENWTFYEVFGLFRLAVIIQQIYRRYHLGQTTNPTFKRYWVAVNYFDVRCRRLIRGA
jgi:aminoglycoside phosphotransferase (APT) family kinase protein